MTTTEHTLASLRVRAGLSLEGAAKLLGISRQTLAKAEEDPRQSTYEFLERAAEIYNSPLSVLHFGPASDLAYRAEAS